MDALAIFSGHSERSASKVAYSYDGGVVHFGASARAGAKARRARQRFMAEGCPCRIDFSRAEATLLGSSGRATSMSFLRGRFMGGCQGAAN